MAVLLELRQMVERTPPSRERVVDFLRASAIVAVVLGHWLISVIDYDQSGQLTARSALPDLGWARPLTWIFQVMPIFFFAGGYANAASLSAYRRDGGDVSGWLLSRAARLVRPTTPLVLTLAGGALLVQALGVDAVLVRRAVWFAYIPLWFLAAYLAVVALTPSMYALHRRYGLAIPMILVGLVAAGDIARLYGDEWWGNGSFLFGWLVIHQLGFFWRDGHLTGRVRLAASLLTGGLAALLLLTLAGPYPISMIDIPGERLHNMSPPSLALLALAISQLGVILLLRDQLERWLHREKPWTLVVAINSVIMTIFLWHITAAIVLTSALHVLDLLPTPTAGAATWLVWRIPWVLMLGAVLAVLVAIFGPLELRSTSKASQHIPDRLVAALTRTRLLLPLTLVGFATIIFGLIHQNLLPADEPALFGLPTIALFAYLTGASLLQLLHTAHVRAPRL